MTLGLALVWYLVYSRPQQQRRPGRDKIATRDSFFGTPPSHPPIPCEAIHHWQSASRSRVVSRIVSPDLGTIQVDHVLASDSESDFDDNNGRPTIHENETPPSADASAAGDGTSDSVPVQAPFTPADAAGGTRSRRTSAPSPISLLPVVEANSPAAALEAAVAAAAAGAEAGAECVAGGAAAAEGERAMSAKAIVLSRLGRG